MDRLKLHVEGGDLLWDVARRAAAITGLAEKVEIIGNCIPVIVTRSDSFKDIIYRCKSGIRVENRRARERRASARLHPDCAFLIVERRTTRDRRQGISEFAHEITARLDSFIGESKLSSAA
jgi:hypothetical protein